MDSLSAIQSYAAQGLRNQAMMSTDAAAVKPQGISLRELEDVQGKSIGYTRSANDSFGSILGRMVNEVNTKQINAQQAVTGLMNGQNVSLHQAVIAMEEAGTSFQLMIEVRNKLLESYQELMRMQV
jgi:flagellar hook-basal body complex protein FliE